MQKRKFLQGLIYLGLLFFTVGCSGDKKEQVEGIGDRFAKGTPNTVTDHKYMLMWQDSQEVGNNRLNWELSKNYCANLTIDGYKDWYLPTNQELNTILDNTKSNPAIDPIFKHIGEKGVSFWTSTSWTSNKNFAHSLLFSGVGDTLLDKHAKAYVRCVRKTEYVVSKK